MRVRSDCQDTFSGPAGTVDLQFTTFMPRGYQLCRVKRQNATEKGAFRAGYAPVALCRRQA
jgi:hypothetical protein